MEEDRLNSPHTSAISLEIFGHQLQFSQDPNSKHLGTTVWDASMVFVKFLERNCRKGKFCPAKLKGKRVIELGAGCGVAGFGMAMLGCDVVTTDQVEVLPLLMRNVDRNTSRILQSHLQTIFSLSGPKTTILLGYEIRNMVVHEQMLQIWKSNFEVKTVPRAKTSRESYKQLPLYSSSLASSI
ncbi:protein N-lysine methyltransferase METTL21A-like isoform X2 [Papaver somniferum]|uniref:protein N-lysine methyltransferase METTL21A-like isoform X2 n=1 Tax=Papaver somniferum TaxID=3469 RepID=UPI000E70185C|nr:protein N-lysine methyltransferase METTL21A-like isoform X2 [Papaver somniferum]